MVISRRQLFTGHALQEETPSALVAVRLPWLKHPEQFTALCTRCGKCEEACPENIIARDDAGYPKLSFENDGCALCGECNTVCPEPLFIDRESQHESEVGLRPWPHSIQLSNACLALNGVACRSCQDPCEMRAINFQLQIGKPALPVLNTDDCTACGACIPICPSNAIAIIHKTGVQQP